MLLNLFAGCTRESFRPVAERNGMALVDVDLEEDLALGSTFSYLIGLALQGRIKILLAGRRVELCQCVAHTLMALRSFVIVRVLEGGGEKG